MAPGGRGFSLAFTSSGKWLGAALSHMGSGKTHISPKVGGGNISNMSGLKWMLRTHFLCTLHNITGPTVQVTLYRNHFWQVLVSHFRSVTNSADTAVRGAVVECTESLKKNGLQSQWGCFYTFIFVLFCFSFLRWKPKKTSPCPTWTWSNSVKSQSSICFFNELEVFDSLFKISLVILLFQLNYLHLL